MNKLIVEFKYVYEDHMTLLAFLSLIQRFGIDAEEHKCVRAGRPKGSKTKKRKG